MRKLLRTKEVSRMLGISVSKIYKMTMSRQIPHSKFLGRLRFDEEKLLQWVEDKSIEIATVDELAARARKLKK